MKNFVIFSILTASIFLLNSCNCNSSDSSLDQKKDLISDGNENIKRVGMVIRLKEDMIDDYKKLHADDYEGVRDLLIKYNMRNFSIFLIRMDDGNFYEFGYYEYTGSNFEEDMKKLALEPRNKAWLEVCDAMQIPLEGFASWAEMDQIFYNL